MNRWMRSIMLPFHQHQLSQRDDFVCWDILREPTHHKTTRVFFEQPSIVLQRIGDAGQVDQGGRTWLRTIEFDLRPHNIGLNTAWMRAQDRSKWRQLVETLVGALLDDDEEEDIREFLIASSSSSSSSRLAMAPLNRYSGAPHNTN